MKKVFIGAFGTVVLVLFFIHCATNPVTGKRGFNFVPESLEVKLGLQSYQEILRKERISTDVHKNEILARVGHRIAQASGVHYDWEFKVIESPVQNAFCLPGGKIAIYTGILPIAKNEAGLAAVLGHEVTHAIARHGGQRMSTQIALLGGLGALSVTTLKDHPNKNLILGLLGAGALVGVTLPFSRANETEADETGQILMARAGYDPRESIELWQRFSLATQGHKQPELLSTHPESEHRARHLRETLAAALHVYEQSSQKLGLGEIF